MRVFWILENFGNAQALFHESGRCISCIVVKSSLFARTLTEIATGLKKKRDSLKAQNFGDICT